MDYLDVVVVLELLRYGARAGGAADHDLLSDGAASCRFPPDVAEASANTVGTAAVKLPFRVEQFIDGGSIHLAARHNHLCAGHRTALREARHCAWNIGTTGKMTSRDEIPIASGMQVNHRVQDIRTMAVEDALRLACRA